MNSSRKRRRVPLVVGCGSFSSQSCSEIRIPRRSWRNGTIAGNTARSGGEGGIAWLLLSFHLSGLQSASHRLNPEKI